MGWRREARGSARLLAAGLALAALSAAHAALPPPVAEALARAGIPESAVGLYVHEVGAPRPLAAHGAERALNPASAIKLLTTYAALELLGPAHTWKTEVHAAGALREGVLEGDLVLKGGGDPKLTLERFWLLLREVRARGVREVRGDLVLDVGYFGAADHDPARFDERPTRPYNTGPSALLVNFKAVRLTFIPEPATRSVRIVSEPALPQVEIVNALAYAEGPCGDWVSRLGTEAWSGLASARLAFRGYFAAACGERTRSYSVLGHTEYVGALFRELWRELGGALAGTVRVGATPPGARPIASTDSPPLAEVVRDINKFSNNVMARQLYLTLGAFVEGPPGTPDKAERALRGWLASKGLAFPELVLENGSGLSRIERISAKSLGELLLAAFASPVMPELVASLPLLAVDGTMKRRLAGAPVAGRAHVKTGLLDGVRAIAGYVLDARGRRVVVVFIVNHDNAAGAQGAQDALLQWVYRPRGSTEAGPS
jgi:D-alanyl-D-alanine carboxypeptidase/D-alanyl-D-alanine-endopeptidase (penicillin-binding protein 4)